MALGEIDFGLYGLVGGLSAFIVFFNMVLAGANARFYAYSVGAVKSAKDKTAAIEECRVWFNTALSVHTLVPVVLVCIGYPIGAYAIENWLTIPTDRIAPCIWVFRFVCLSCFVAMVNAPFHAMYTAKQYIAELTIYGFVTSTLNVLALYYMITHSGNWLTRYAAWTAFIGIAPQVLICIRACIIFPECKFNKSYFWKMDYVKRLGAFAGWQFLGMMCQMLRTNGMSIVVNKFFGAQMNAAQTVGNHVQSQCFSLAGAMQGAFTPVITQACGAKDYAKMNSFVIRACKFNILLAMIFAIPLSIELDNVITLWLKNPPACSVGLCYCALIYHLVGCSTTGHMVAVNATGRIAAYHVVLCAVNIFTLPLAVLIGVLTCNVYWVVASTVFMEGLNSIGRLLFARRNCGTSIREWVAGIVIPSGIVCTISIFCGCLPRLILGESFTRICITTVVCEAVFLPLSWYFILSPGERQFVVEKVGSRLSGLLGKRNANRASA